MTAEATGSGEQAPLQASASGWRWLPWTVLVLLVDQASKNWVQDHFALYESVPLLPVLDFTRLHNSGAAFSFLHGAGGWQRWLFSALAVVVSVALVAWLRRIRAASHAVLAAGLALIVGGALGNLVDRVRFGFVIDFVHVHWGQAYFPAFNVADSAITIGAGLLLLDALSEWRRERRSGA